jgi:predicted ferric reductase
MFALSGKVNIVSVLTGISYEKLNALHRWTAWICLILSIIHTAPFIWQPLHEGGYQRLRTQFYAVGGMEFTGTPPVVILFAMVALSLPFIRSRMYELWVATHWLFAIAYVGLMFWHAAQELDSVSLSFSTYWSNANKQ